MKIGLFVNDIKVKEYDYYDYPQALEDADYAYKETLIPHEIKII